MPTKRYKKDKKKLILKKIFYLIKKLKKVTIKIYNQSDDKSVNSFKFICGHYILITKLIANTFCSSKKNITNRKKIGS